jgi:hypothetical protein
MKLRRLARMTVSELLGRSQQEALKRLERAGWATPSAPRADCVAGDVADGGSSDVSSGGAAGRRPLHPRRTLARGGTKDYHALGEQISSSASISSGTGIFPSVIRWTGSLDRSRSGELLSCTGAVLDPLDRHGTRRQQSHLGAQSAPLGGKVGCAYRLSGDERYAEAAIRFIDEWVDANPPGYGHQLGKQSRGGRCA